MKLRSLAALVMVVALVALAAPAAWAQPGKTPGLRESLSDEAGSRFDEGSRLYRAAEFSAAREAFLAAYAKSGDPRILYNVAVCDKSLGRYARAITTLRSSLASTGRPLSSEYTQRASETIATLSRYVAFVSVSTSVDGATITVDGEVLRDNPVPLETGTHTVSALKEGFETASESVQVKAGETREVKLTLAPSQSPGEAAIRCLGPSPCDVFVDDEAFGRAPVTVARSAGLHRIQVFVGGKKVDERTVEFRNGTSVAVTLSARPPAVARLRLATDNADDRITIDGTPSGRSGLDVELEPGEHHVLISRPGGATKSVDVLLRPNETRDMRVSLDEKKGISPWWFIGGGVLLAGATAAGIFFATRPTTYEGSNAGTLNPFVIPASRATLP